MKILFDSRWLGPHGIGRVAQEYRNRLGQYFDILDLDRGPAPSSQFDSIFTARAFAKSKADVFFTPGFNGSPLIKAPQIMMIHDLIHLQQGQSGRMIRTLYYDTVIRAAAKRAQVITVSDFSRDAIEARWPEQQGRIKVISNGVSEAFCAPRPAAPERRGIVVFTNDRWHKNFDGMCRALAAWQAQDSLAAQHPVHFVGREVDPAAHPDILRVQNRVALKSASDPALANLLASSAALLLCSHHEGFGLPVVEALASGAMPVVSDLAVFREIGGSDCIYVDRHDPAAIAQGLSQAIRATVPEGVSQAISQRFGWSQSGQHMAQVLRDLVAA